jgi:hypothetical protein
MNQIKALKLKIESLTNAINEIYLYIENYPSGLGLVLYPPLVSPQHHLISSVV